MFTRASREPAKGRPALRILVANKFWYRRAGLERVMFDEISWLEAAGHSVAHFAAAHPENDASPWSAYFAPYFELGPHTTLPPRRQVAAAGNMFWNPVAARRFERLLRDFRPDVVHVHGIHYHLSPSILAAARRAGVPVVQSLHDHHPICPADDLLLGGSVACDPVRCGRFNVLPCVSYQCVQHSTAKSALAATELLWRRWVVRIEYLVSAFISPSRYLARMVQAGGLRHRPVHILPNAIPDPGVSRDAPGDTFVYAGRLSREKGLPTLLRAVQLADAPLVIAGDGPLRSELTAASPPRVRFVGRVDGDEVNRLLAGARAAILPSEGAENAPMAVLEAMVLGCPVVATRMGGIPELARDGIEGILFDAGDTQALAAALRRLAGDDALAERLGRAARARAISTYAPGAHLDGLVAIYESVLRARQPSSPSAV